jgi:tRNA G18 (ribose-2'-O)-methylase SpoU
MKITRVTSLEIPELQPYRTLRRSTDHHRQGLFVAEGEKVVRRLLESRLTTVSLLLTPEWYDKFTSMLEDRTTQPEVFIAEKPLLESIVGFHLHQGIMAVGRIPKHATLEDVAAKSPHPYLFVAIDGMTNSENLGVLVRNCAAFGVHALIVGETSSSPYLRRAVRNSMGTVFRLPVVEATNLVETLYTLRTNHATRTLAAHPRSDSKPIAEVELSGNCCIAFGSEGEGISPAVLQACDELITIPMQSGVDSLNVASASAVVLYEVQRQRL